MILDKFGIRSLFGVGILVVGTALAGCTSAPPSPTPDIPTPVGATSQQALPAATPVIPATVQAEVRAAVAAVPTEKPIPTPTAIPTVSHTPEPTDTPNPTATPTPKPTPAATPAPEQSPTPESQPEKANREELQFPGPHEMVIESGESYSADIHTNRGVMTVELFAGDAPITVNNFIVLARQGFYDGVVFHRVIPQFMIQGGDPTGTGGGGPGYVFEDEIVPSLVFDSAGLLAMANAGPGTNGSQFFITVVPTPHLNGFHTIFGKVTAGQEVANAISVTETDDSNRPLEAVVIETIEIQGDS